MSSHFLVFFFLIIRRPRRSTLFPYTTLFRSGLHQEQRDLVLLRDPRRGQPDVARDDPADRHDAFPLDQPLDRAGAFLAHGLVVGLHQLELAAVDVAGLVDLVDGELHPVTYLHAPRREVARQRREHADADRLGAPRLGALPVTAARRQQQSYQQDREQPDGRTSPHRLLRSRRLTLRLPARSDGVSREGTYNGLTSQSTSPT